MTETTGTILDRIIARKEQRLAAALRAVPLPAMIAAAAEAPPPRDFAGALTQRPEITLIAEIKGASPSRGRLRTHLDPEALAAAYARAGADALSVITEEDYFLGRNGYLRRARTAAALPILRKDFMFHPYHIQEARALGADAVLLIVAVLEDGRLEELIALTRILGMTALVEVHSGGELDRALRIGAEVVGINNRNLKTMRIETGTGEDLLSAVPEDILTVIESGISDPDDVRRFQAAGADAMLVGEAIVRAADPGAAIHELLKGRDA